MTVAPDPWAAAVSTFGASVASKLAGGATSGAPEDQLRAPLERLIADLAPALQLAAADVVLKGESSLSDLKVRPDYAVERRNALIGFIEVKAPGKGTDPRRFDDKHDRAQWEKLKALPNLIYTDGNGFSLWRDGKREGEIVQLQGDVRSSGASLAAPAGLVRLLSDFLSWKPEPPRSPKQLAQVSARLCRLLRDEVLEQLEAGARGLTSLKSDWRKLLFPEADDAHFADGYAQAVTFGLLMAKARGISLADGLDDAAKSLRRTSTLIGTALRLLTDEAEEDQPSPTLWNWHSGQQIYATALMAHSPTSGPALTFTGLIPDLHHYKGSFGGRVFPLWRNATATTSNVAAGELDRLELAYGRAVPGEAVFAYVAAVAAHPAYTAQFAEDLRQPGLRIPLTADAALFAEAVALGREVVWLHTFGERWAEGRPAGAPAVEGGGQTQPGADALSDADRERRSKASAMPDTLDYDPTARRLWVGGVVIDNVDPAVWAYDVSGKTVLTQWFGYRRATRVKPAMGDRRPPSPLQKEQPKTWPAEYTTELVRLLRVLTRLVALEPLQAGLLDRILSSPLLGPDL